MRSSFLPFLVSLVLFGVLRVCNGGVLEKNFYKKSCPQAEMLVRNITWSKTKNNPALGAKLLRVHYHDCFVRGCDASLLLDTVGAEQSEKDARPNLSLSGFDVIDEIKTRIELECPGVVSCADIVALAAPLFLFSFLFGSSYVWIILIWKSQHEDVLILQFKKPIFWDVLTGRRDGKVSRASEVAGNLPSPFSNFTTLRQLFAAKKLNVNDLVVLSGNGAELNLLVSCDADPSLNPTYANSLRAQCPNPANAATTVEMDPQSSLSFDNHYYEILNQNKGLFQSDAALLTDRGSAKIVRQLQTRNGFFSEFGKSMQQMAAIEVLTGKDGKIRKKCRVVNS
ncbi:hypothetical protein HHK36_026609 [Tetracentron sinense]|uniref:Peroxidase n=1 Tax=Tetracentron sinense TaxID=13715 RepID=A0A834YFC5_TETSI|nr:hypothetical protein HHK36_026609 [Tetracentron sinense]